MMLRLKTKLIIIIFIAVVVWCWFWVGGELKFSRDSHIKNIGLSHEFDIIILEMLIGEKLEEKIKIFLADWLDNKFLIR